VRAEIGEIACFAVKIQLRCVRRGGLMQARGDAPRAQRARPKTLACVKTHWLQGKMTLRQCAAEVAREANHACAGGRLIRGSLQKPAQNPSKSAFLRCAV
jgi:hypothetical protein